MLVLITAACGGVDPAETAPEPNVERTTYSVGVDGTADDFTGSFHKFFPRMLTVHPGDTIVFQRPENGEPHTVTLGTDAPTSESLPGGNFFSGGFGGPPLLKAAMPCFLTEGIPASEGCSSDQQERVPFDGKQSWYNSGGLLGDEEFTLQLAESIAPGSYPFVCLAHPIPMRGQIQVVGPGEPADDPADVIARADEEMQREAEAIRSRVEAPPSVSEGEVDAAIFGGLSASVWANMFFPEEVEIPVGGTVTWNVRHIHTIAFNAPESASPFYERADDGSVQENEEGAEEQGDFAGWDGTGFLNSGLLEGFQPPGQFSVTFDTPGTYSYQCLVHFDMEGRVKVSG
ncbi:MAG TPA: hypothetical protein VF097_06240 [Actinomycetota bacterium]